MTIEINDRWTVATPLDNSPQAATRSWQTSLAHKPDASVSDLSSSTYDVTSGKVKDESTLDLVQHALQHCGYEQLRRVKSYCHHGRVVLQGRVATYYLKQVAQEVVLNIKGVRDVDNDLHVVCSR